MIQSPPLRLTPPIRLALATCLALAVLVGPATHRVLAQDDPGEAVLQITTESEQATAHSWAGVDDVENVFLSRGAMHFEQALGLDPDFGMAQFMHARFAPGMGRAERLEKMATAIGVLANASAGESALATGIREQFAGNAREARAMYVAASRIAPDNPHVAFYRAAFTGAGGSPDRLRALTNVRDAHPTFAASANTLAYLQWNMGDQAGARQNVARYMEMASSHPNSHDSYAELFQFSGMSRKPSPTTTWPSSWTRPTPQGTQDSPRPICWQATATWLATPWTGRHLTPPLQPESTTCFAQEPTPT